ncbi:hypothetical protein T02_1210 [Trichinella nativa]|uniref:Uncharacterized protein n=1 Tax=Trichinella nativa TaxID=6335 RepID=A0A0V1KXU3_9BILA|nr:hypothetical protein T02_1210 [Trichinella nativa]
MTIKFTSLIQIKQLLPKYNDLEVMQKSFTLHAEFSLNSLMRKVVVLYGARFCKNSDLAQKKTILKLKINIVEIYYMHSCVTVIRLNFQNYANFFVKVADEPLFFSY